IEKPYDKAKAIYDWIAAEIDYINDQNVDISAKPYDVFKDEKGVCGGFSNLMREMMRLAGIPAVAIAGNYQGNLPHQWNAVYAGDKWVYADGTATGNNLFDVESLDNTHHALEILDVTIDLDTLKLGYYGGLAVVGTTGSKVSIPEKYQEYPITALSYRLFGNDYQVEEIEINNNITKLDENTISTMKSSSALREIRVLEGNKNYASREGVLFSADYSALLVYPSAATLTSFTLPAQINNVDIKDAFSSPNLENINVEKDSEGYSSYEGALYDKNQSTLLYVPAGKTSIRVLDNAEISEQAFAYFTNTNKEKITIIAASASPAAEFARKNDYKLQVTDEVKVTFNDENNELINEWNVVIGQTVTAPQVAEREGYTFLGWFTENGEQPFDFSTAITEALVLTQRWEAKNEEGGSVSGNTPGGSVSGNETPGGSVSGNETPGGSVSGNTPGGSVSENEVPEGIWGVVIGDKEYDGKKQTRFIIVYDGKKPLQEKVDYTVSYKNNINSAVYTQEELNSWLEAAEKGSVQEKKEANKKLSSLPQAVIKMKGNYSGTESVYFQILPKSISGNDIAAQDLYVTYKANKEQKPTPVISWNGKKLGKKDFKVVTYENKEINFVGKENETVTIPLTIEGTGNYTGTTTVDLTIAQPKATFDMNKMKVTIKGAAKYKVSWEDWKKMDYQFSEADIAVKNGNSEVSQDSYQITGYVNHRQAGTATVILQGKKESGYHGRKLVTFQIAGTSMSEVDVYSETNHDYKKTGYPYTGKNVMLLEQNGIYVAMKNNKEQKLTLGEEFTASYGACIEKGTVTLELVGNPEKGFTGSKKVTYKIAQEDLVNVPISFEAENTPAKIMKGGAKPEVQLMLGEKQLIEGKDYTLTYKKNKDVTDGEKTAEVLIKGKGNFKGSITKKFAIEKKGIEEGATVAARDLVSKNGSWKQSFKVYDADGKELKANKDYVKEAKYEKAVSGNDGSVSYEEVTSVQPGDVIRITVTGMGNYAGSGAAASVVTGTYRILQENYDISKAKIVIAPQLYNGDKVELTLDQKVFTKAEIVKGKQIIPLFDQEGKACFEIVEGSYQKNDRKGTAKVTLRGTGSFGGEKTVTFKINSRPTSESWKGVYEHFFSILLDFVG
ncbi:MAG: InlB B-repeat-containing protein, partial [Lachnospiraceae bacterium]|nr:InlB B-repeat-containing protein [Lachnospiraceae bacterium]